METCEDDEVDARPNAIICHRLNQFQDLRENEAESFGELITRHLPSGVNDWTCNVDGWSFDLTEVGLEVFNNANAPINVKATSSTMTRKFLDPLRVELREMISKPSQIYLDVTGFAVLLLQLVEECVASLASWKAYTGRLVKTQKVLGIADRTEKRQTFLDHIDADEPELFKASEVSSWHSAVRHGTSLDLSSVKDTAKHLLGKSIVNICKDIEVSKDDFRILHVEPVFRSDLVARFWTRQRAIRQDLLDMSYEELRQSVDPRKVPYNSRDDTLEGLADALAEVSVTFHGAPRHVLESIVRYGFVVPGESLGGGTRTVQVVHGASFGIGVYSSPDPNFAMCYGSWETGTVGGRNFAKLNARNTPGLRIIVCATLMGRAATVQRADARRCHGLLVDHAHSHVSPNQKEYIVFNSAQIIPCYVLHMLDAKHLMDEASIASCKANKLSLAALLGPSYNTEHKEYDRRGNEIRWPADEIRRKRAMKAGAMKHFPFGFGTATGTNFVIEDIAGVSDDEEVYGDYQHWRIKQDNELSKKDVARGASNLDQYQNVRKTKNEVFSDPRE